MAKEERLIKGAKEEMKKMKWPTAKEVVKYSLTTIGLALFFIIFFILISLLASFIKGLFV